MILLHRTEFTAYRLIPVSLPEFITDSCHVMTQITGRIVYCRNRRMNCDFGHLIHLLITSNTNVTRNPAKKNCFASVHQCCIVFEELHKISRFRLQVLHSKKTRERESENITNKLKPHLTRFQLECPVLIALCAPSGLCIGVVEWNT